MAPEILLKHSYSPLADLWSIGVILYTCIFGRAPYSSKSLDELLQKIKTKQKIIIARSAAISPECRDIMERLLKNEPDQRITFDQFFNHPFLNAKIPQLKQVTNDEVQYILFYFKFSIYLRPCMELSLFFCFCFFSHYIQMKELGKGHCNGYTCRSM